MFTYKEIGKKMLEMIVNAINNGETLPWVRPWKGGVNPFCMGAVSHSTGKPYSFMNQWFLGGEGEWITANECKKQGISFAGAKARTIYWASQCVIKKKDKEGNEYIDSFPCLKGYCVFNVKDLGITPKYLKKDEEKVAPIKTSERIAVGENAIADYVAKSGITFVNNINSSRAFYSPSDDKVVVPNIEQYSLTNEYYSTTFHEMVHSTMKENRCNRPQDEDGVRACFGNAPYAKEELVAELGSCMLLSRLGISTETTERNSAAYLKDWLGALKDDTAMIAWAANRAEKAVKYILNETETAIETKVA